MPGLFHKTNKQENLESYIKWFCKETHTKLYTDQIRYEKNLPYLIDCLDYDRYEQIFYNAGFLYSIKKNSSCQKDSKEALWQELRLHILNNIGDEIKFNRLSSAKKELYEKFVEGVNKEIILTEEQKAYKIAEFKKELLVESKETVTINDFYIETKEYVFKIQPYKFNNEKEEFNSFNSGLIDNYKFTESITEIPEEFDKLLSNLAGDKEKHWLINHMAAYIQNFVSGWKLHRKIETIPVFYGKQGTGKNTIMEMFNKLITADYLCEVDRQMFESGFSEWKKSAVILLNEFGKTKDDKRDFSNKLKLLTSPTFNINEKFKPALNIENKCYIAIAANESMYGALNIEESDRRYQYISGGKNISKNEAYSTGKVFDINELEKQLINFGNFLLNYKVDWDLADTVFLNESKLEDLENSKDQYEKTIDFWMEELGQDREYVSATEVCQYAKYFENFDLHLIPMAKRLSNRFGKCKDFGKKEEYILNGKTFEVSRKRYKI